MELLLPKQGWAAIFLNSFYIGFVVFTIICLVMRVFVKRKIGEIGTNLQYSVNLVFAFGIVLRVFFLAFILYPATGDGEILDVNFNRPAIPDEATEQNTLILIGDIILWSIGFLFLFPSLRRSWVLSALALLLMDPGYLFSGLIKVDREYLPSQWGVFHENEWMIKASQIVFFMILTLLMYFFLYKRKKLPYL